ncbi:hypothetical protein K458DRAFT_417998 [Lentithecium fluviatile CBS 122367]|uniref:Uncharacterized protein n=1 Tax=Lentithecium fluviatile CBS 122367 TaxID=1168545 RepID=A0A6G1J1M4_9PLEO|nr:hypothetical protein K458DRAFT_417998 [Lentithecium fluviatile CBS 122367]
MAKKSKSGTAKAPMTSPRPPSLPSNSSSSSGIRIPTSASEPSYFSRFTTFAPKADTNFLAQFNALAISQGWSKKEKAKRRVDAIQGEFEYLYGTDTTRLDKWQDLCREVGIEEVPGSITKCKKALGSRKVMVNLVNLIDHRRRGVPLHKFANYGAFCAYTMKHKFPREMAKKDGFIRALLRHVC